MLRSTVFRPVIVLTLAALAAGCGATSANAPTATPTPTPSPTPRPTAPPGATVAEPKSIGAPTPRSGAAMAYDPQTKSLIVFGGQGTPGTPARNDMWSWDGQHWKQLRPDHRPPAVAGAGLVLDPVSGHLLLVSGAGALDASGFPVQQGTWSWNGSDWARVADNPIQDGPVNVAADPAHKQVVLDGAGYTGAGPDTPPPTFIAGSYVWNGTAWAKAPSHLTGTMSVMGSHGAGIAFDPISQRVIEFGGGQQAAFGDTLAWDGSSWKTLQSQVPPTPTAFNPGAASPTAVPASVPPPGNAVAATDPTYGHIIMLAGYIENTKLATTWSFNGATWTRVRGTEPPALIGASMAFDPAVGGVVVFAGLVVGSDGTTPLATNGVYVWRGNGWQLAPAPQA